MLPAPLNPDVLEPVHEPVPDDARPKVRPKMQLWDRLKFLVLIAVIFALLVAKQKSDIPIMSVGEAIKDQLRSKWWLLVLAGIEVLRQLHYLICEHSARYNQFWEEHIWGAWNRRVEKMNPWLRYRINRVFRFTVVSFVVLAILAGLWNVPLLTALVEAPSRLWDLAFGPLQSMPALVYILFFVGMAIIQFVAIFWFMSKGGVDTYMPAEIKTRFADVWGQDHVLERVKENIVFLEKPEEIETKGGHVPGGILLWGPPGTGKTLMAEAVAGETGKPYVFVDPGGLPEHVLRRRHPEGEVAVPQAAQAGPAVRRRDRVLRRGRLARQPGWFGRQDPVRSPPRRRRSAGTSATAATTVDVGRAHDLAPRPCTRARRRTCRLRVASRA